MTAAHTELFSKKVTAGTRTYFFDIKESTGKGKYLVISESRLAKDSTFEHNRVMVFEENLRPFYLALRRTMRWIRRNTKTASPGLAEIRKRYPRAYEKWTESEDAQLKETFEDHRSKTINEIAEAFSRKPGAISSRLRKLGLIQE